MDLKINKEVKKENLIVFLSFITYFAVTICKYSYSSSLSLIIDHFEISKSAAGLITTVMFIVYGSGQVIHGFLCKFYNVKFSVFLGMLLSGISTLAMAFLPFGYYVYLMAINGLGCSFLWTSLVRLMAENLSEKKLSAGVLANAFSVSIGVALAYGLAALSSLISYFQLTFIVSSTFTLIVSLMWLFLIKISNAEVKPIRSKKEEKENKKNYSFSLTVLLMLAIFAIAAIGNNMIREGVVSWTPKYLIETYSLNESLSTILAIVNSFLSLGGTFIALLLRKKIKSDMLLSFLLFILTTALSLVMVFFYNSSMSIFIVSSGFISIAMGGVNNIITAIVPVYFRDELPSGLIAGLMDGFCYIGSAISGYGLGLMAEKEGWNGVFLLFFISGLVISILLILGYFLTKKKNKA